MAEPSLTGGFDLPFQEQIDFFRQKIKLPTAKWDDIWQAAHDRAFVVAGAAKADLLDDLARAVDKAISSGTTLESFRADFRQIVFNRGWHGWTGEGSEAGFNWRTKVIYETNLRTSYAAGREAQLADPGLQKLMPFRRYVHNDSVLNPRPQHLAWNGLTLPHDHPFWKTHSPPNGWGCRCHVVAAIAPRQGDRTEPPAGWDQPGEDGRLPGIDRGWGYAPGKSNLAGLRHVVAEKARGLPPELQKPFLGDTTAAMDDSEAFSKGAPVGKARPESENLLPPEPTGPPVKGSLWKHPGTGQERIYFNGIADPGVKVFAVENSGMFEIRFQGPGMYGSQKDKIMDDLDRRLEAWKGGRVVRWDDLKELMAGGVKKTTAPVAPPAPPANPFSRVVDMFGNGSRVQYFNDAKGVFVESQRYPSGITKWRAGEVVDGRDQWMGDANTQFKTREEAEAAIRGLKISEGLKASNAKKYGSIPKGWDGDARKIARQLADAGIDVERFSASTQSKSKYIYLDNGLKIRLADHDLPGAYDAPDLDFRYGDDVKAFLEEIKLRASKIEKNS